MSDQNIPAKNESDAPQQKYPLLHWAGKKGTLLLGPSFGWMVLGLASIAARNNLSFHGRTAFVCGAALAFGAHSFCRRFAKCAERHDSA